MNRLTFYSSKQLKSTTPLCTEFKLRKVKRGFLSKYDLLVDTGQ